MTLSFQNGLNLFAATAGAKTRPSMAGLISGGFVFLNKHGGDITSPSMFHLKERRVYSVFIISLARDF